METTRCGNALNHQQAGLKDAARQLEQAAQNHTEIAVAQSTAQTQANMIADLLVTEKKKAESQVSLQQLQLLKSSERCSRKRDDGPKSCVDY